MASVPTVDINFGAYNPTTGTTHFSFGSGDSNTGSSTLFLLLNSKTGEIAMNLGSHPWGTQFDIVFPVGSWKLSEVGNGSTYQSAVFTISAKPADPPSGYLNLLRYYNKYVD
ncbi:MAG: hypothetical protein JWQ06_2551 [Mucilaginibacter sp.]|nr:hypothetical protein [Mucilaginibacter sp.]